MNTNHIDPMILGHNQFYGTDHLSSERGAKRAQYFSDIGNVLNVIRFATDEGVTGLMLSTHPLVSAITDAIRRDATLREGLNLYPNIPYIAKYVREVSEKGIVNMVSDILKSANLSEKFKILLHGGVGVVRKDFLKLMGTLIDIEMLPFKQLQVKAIFLHNVLTDLALGMRAKSAFEFYVDYIETNYKGVIPAFTTANLPLLVKTLKDWGIENPLVMSAVNKVGFGLNPSLEAIEKCLKGSDVRLVAMETLASGYLKPQEAYDYLYTLPKVESVVVGASSKEHIKETFGIIKSHLKKKAIL